MRRVLTPGWIAAHIAVAAVVGTCTVLGIWQLRRLDERRAHNALLRERAEAGVAPLGSLFAEAPTATGAMGAAFRQVEVSGAYLPGSQRLTGPRSFRGAPGRHVLTPLRTSMGYDVLVERGWIPLDAGPGPAAPPGGEVQLVGVLMPPEPPSFFRRNTDGGPVVRIDPAELHAKPARPMLQLYVRLVHQRPAQPSRVPVPLDPPRVAGDGPHLSYAVQWFIFGAIAAGGYALVLRRQMRRMDGDPHVPLPESRAAQNP